MNNNKENLDKIAFGICLAGVLLAVVIAILGRVFGLDLIMHAFSSFAAFQLAAVVLGIICWTAPLGKAASITGGILLITSLLLLT